MKCNGVTLGRTRSVRRQNVKRRFLISLVVLATSGVWAPSSANAQGDESVFWGAACVTPAAESVIPKLRVYPEFAIVELRGGQFASNGSPWQALCLGSEWFLVASLVYQGQTRCVRDDGISEQSPGRAGGQIVKAFCETLLGNALKIHYSPDWCMSLATDLSTKPERTLFPDGYLRFAYPRGITVLRSEHLVTTSEPQPEARGIDLLRTTATYPDRLVAENCRAGSSRGSGNLVQVPRARTARIPRVAACESSISWGDWRGNKVRVAYSNDLKSVPKCRKKERKLP